MRWTPRIAAVAALFLAAPAAFADTYPRQPAVDAWHYVFRLEISDTSPAIAGEATVDLLVVRDGVAEDRARSGEPGRAARA